MEPGLRGADRDVERRRHVGQRHPEVEVQDHDRPPLGPQPLEGGVEQVAVGDEGGHVADRRSVDRRQLDLDRPSAAPANGVDAGSEHQAVEPRLEAIRIAEGGQVPPGADEALLDRVSRELGVPKDQAGRRVQPRDEHAGERGEGVMIASHRSLDEFSLVHDHPR